MSPHLCIRLLRISPREAIHVIRRPAAFSTSSIQKAQIDPAAALQDTVSPAKTPRPEPPRPTPSRSPDTPTDASNPMMQGYPSAETPGTMTTSTATADTTTPEPASPQQRPISSHFTTRSPAVGSHQRAPQNSIQNILNAYSNGSAQQNVKSSLSFPQGPPASRRRLPPRGSDIRRRVDRENEMSGRRLGPTQAAEASKQTANAKMAALERQATRIWRSGDVYAPHDLSPVEQMKARSARQGNGRFRMLSRARSRKQGGADAFDILRLDPVKEYKNFTMMGEFVSQMGRIRGARETGLRAVNQRKLAKAVRRSIGMGLIPSVHRHPELLEIRRQHREKVWRRRERAATSSAA